MSDQVFGWDLLFSSIEKDIKSNQDLLVGFAHFVLISNGFKCIGLGESKVLDNTEAKTEALPKGWTQEYTLRYVHQGALYILKGTNVDDAIVLNLIRVEERNVSILQLNTRLVVKRSGSLEEMMPEYQSVMDMIKNQLIQKVVVSIKSKEQGCQTESQAKNPLQVDRPPPMRNTEDNSFRPFGRFSDPIGVGNVGRSDLDPFGLDPLRIARPPGVGGGMLFSPPQGPTPPGPLGMPPGSIPPGARFDPFRPPDVDLPPSVSSRHGNDLPPPGFDDMFM